MLVQWSPAQPPSAPGPRRRPRWAPAGGLRGPPSRRRGRPGRPAGRPRSPSWRASGRPSRGARPALGIATIGDLLEYLPVRYEAFDQDVRPVAGLRAGEEVTVRVRLDDISVRPTRRRGLRLVRARVHDDTGRMVATWFNQEHLARMLGPGDELLLRGRVGGDGRREISVRSHEILGGGGSEGLHTRGPGAGLPRHRADAAAPHPRAGRPRPPAGARGPGAPAGVDPGAPGPAGGRRRPGGGPLPPLAPRGAPGAAQDGHRGAPGAAARPGGGAPLTRRPSARRPSCARPGSTASRCWRRCPSR